MLAVRQLALTAPAAGHAGRRMHQLESAAQVRAIGRYQIGDDAARVVSNELGTRIPVVPPRPAPAGPPARPKRSEVVHRGLARDLEELPRVGLAVTERRAHFARHAARALPLKCDRLRTLCRGTEPGPGGGAACRKSGSEQKSHGSRSNYHVASPECAANLPP